MLPHPAFGWQHGRKGRYCRHTCVASWLKRILPSSGASPPATDCAAAARHCLATKVGTLTSQTFLPACPVSSGLAAAMALQGIAALSAGSPQLRGCHVWCRATRSESRARSSGIVTCLSMLCLTAVAGGGVALKLHRRGR